MRIKSVTASNFKGLDFSYQLAPVTFISGDNFAGKTAIATAIRLALAGYLPPPIGTKGVYALAGDPDSAGEMSIKLELDNGRAVHWTWKRDSKGKISVVGGVPPDLLMPPLLMEPKLFFAKTATERVQAIFECCPEVGDLKKAISDRLGELIIPVKQRETELVQLAKLISNTPLDGLLQLCKDEAKHWGAETKRLSAQMTAIALPTQVPKDVHEELGIARGELSRLMVGSATDQALAKKELGKIDEILSAYSRKHKLTPVENLMEFLDHELQTVSKDLRGLKPVPPVDEEQDELVALQTEQKRITDAMDKAREQIEPLKVKLADLQIADHCPVCLSKTQGWKLRAESNLKEEIERLDTNIQKWITHLAPMDRRIAELLNWLLKVQTEKQHTAERKVELYKLAEGFTADRDNILVLLQDRTKLMASVSLETDADRSKAIAELESRIDELNKTAAARGNYEALIRQSTVLESDLASAQLGADIYKALAKIVTEEQSKATEKAFSTVLKSAQLFTDGILNSPLEFENGELGRRVSKADRDHGCKAQVGSWISHEVFSDSEQRVAYAAFSVALASKVPVKLVVIDELATLGEKRRIDFVDRLLELTMKGVIDQAICIEPTQYLDPPSPTMKLSIEKNFMSHIRL